MKTYNDYLTGYKRGFIGFTTLSVLAQSCLGAIAAMFILMGGTSIWHMIQLFFVTIFCMGFNAAVLSQQKPKFVFAFLIVSVSSSIFFSLLNIHYLFA
ncbi:hypothetical protein ABH942_000788 [Flavobacterium sp. 28YEA47A]|uniref:hypothetical protein n=1 Tax=Flavobacterium sp. 28YEA47A TaxID=3156276 RepID=UPI0035157A8F